MRVVTVIDILEGGGKERRLVELLKGLDNYPNIESHLIVLSNRIGYDQVYEVQTTLHIEERRGKHDYSIIWRLKKLLGTIDPDVIQCWDLMSAFYTLPVSKIMGVPFINASISHAPDRIKRFSKNWWRSRLTFPWSQAVVANSKAGLRSYKVSGAKYHTINNGFDLKRIESLQDQKAIRAELGIKHDIVIGMTGAFRSRKDYHTFLEAAMIILKQHQDVCFLAVGDGEKLPGYREKYAKHAAGRLILPGARKDIESIVNIFTIGVLSTYTEGISNSIMEYMVLGKPVVATDGGGTKELVEDGVTGYLVQRESIEDMVEKINWLLKDLSKAHQMGLKGKERIINHFALDRMTTDYIHLFESLSN